MVGFQPVSSWNFLDDPFSSGTSLGRILAGSLTIFGCVLLSLIRVWSILEIDITLPEQMLYGSPGRQSSRASQ